MSRSASPVAAGVLRLSMAMVSVSVLLALGGGISGSSTVAGAVIPSGTAHAAMTSSASSTAGADLPVKAPQVTCAQVATTSFASIPGASTTITSATAVAKSASNSFAYCDVKGTVAATVGFELLLPTATYEQRYLQEGCEGLCGTVRASATPTAATGCAQAESGAFVIGQDDEGHMSAGLGGTSATWAESQSARIEFGYRSEHVFALAAKAITASFYGAPPKYSYYDGCSDGGREALMEAQRYPTDFNGILAGAPAFNQTALNAFEEAYLATIDFNADGSTIMPATKLAALHSAVEAKCADPALHDDTIQNPHSCNFDPASIQCKGATDTTSCLTAAQVAVVRKAYAGVVAPDGTHLYTGGEPYGSELAWSGLLIPEAGQGQSSLELYGIGVSFLDYLITKSPQPNLKLSPALFTVANLHKAQKAVSNLYDSTNPDLKSFYKAGGKLIMWQGLADQNIPPAGTLAYRQAVIDTMGSSTVDKFYRLYMFPGVYHCGNGTGPSTFDLLGPLLAWTESGTAPGAVVASSASATSSSGPSSGQLGGTQSGAGSGGPSGGFAGPSGGTGSGGFAGPSGGASGGSTGVQPSATSTTAVPTTITRPVYPYPQLVKYDGTGDVNDASNYKAYTPTSRSDRYSWAGSFTAS